MNADLRLIQSYIAFFENMTRDDLDRLADLVDNDVRFVDPFNDVIGVKSMRRIFERMFAEFANPKFQVLNVGKAGDRWLMRWRFAARSLANGDLWTIDGMSEVACGPDGRVILHIDHWDAGRQVYERLPFIGAIIRAVRRRLSA